MSDPRATLGLWARQRSTQRKVSAWVIVVSVVCRLQISLASPRLCGRWRSVRLVSNSQRSAGNLTA